MKLIDIRGKLQKALANPHRFVQAIDTSTLVLKERKNRGQVGTLQKIIITDIPHDHKYKRFWLLDKLESRKIKGFSTADKTVEAFIISYSANAKRLTVYMIEMKSKMRNETVEDILGKFEDSMSRFYLLFCLNSNHNIEEFKEATLHFKGLVFFNEDATKRQRPDRRYDDIYKAFKRKKALVFCETITERVKIPIKFILSERKEQHTISFKNLK